jgi:hypothetical protein
VGGKPILDEETFTKLLAAAYVMQEHQDQARSKAPASDFTQIISQVVETRHLIQTRKLTMDAALDTIVGRLLKMTYAAGAAVGVVGDSNVQYKAAGGTAAPLLASEIPLESSLSAHCIRKGENLLSPVAEADSRVDRAQIRRVGARSMLAVPIYHEGTAAGAIELFFTEVSAFHENDVRACELMAGVATEVMAQTAEQELKQELASERASVLMALEKLKPQLQKLAGLPAQPAPEAASPEPGGELCRACGKPFVGNEAACGICGAARGSGQFPGSELQSKWAALWEKHAAGTDSGEVPIFHHPPPQAGDQPDLEHKLSSGDASESAWEHEPAAFEADRSEETAIVKVEEDGLAREELRDQESRDLLWDSALGAKKWLKDRMADDSTTGRLGRFLVERAGDVSLALAAVVVLATLLWIFWPKSHSSVAATNNPPVQGQVKRRPKPKQPQLTLFEKALVSLGLAEPPPPVPYMGDPNARVWVDVNTGLYYCPGAEAYGNTAKGKYTTQEDAQLDAFEPATRKPCD